MKNIITHYYTQKTSSMSVSNHVTVFAIEARKLSSFNFYIASSVYHSATKLFVKARKFVSLLLWSLLAYYLVWLGSLTILQITNNTSHTKAISRVPHSFNRTSDKQFGWHDKTSKKRDESFMTSSRWNTMYIISKSYCVTIKWIKHIGNIKLNEHYRSCFIHGSLYSEWRGSLGNRNLHRKWHSMVSVQTLFSFQKFVLPKYLLEKKLSSFFSFATKANPNTGYHATFSKNDMPHDMPRDWENDTKPWRNLNALCRMVFTTLIIEPHRTLVYVAR